MRIKHVFLQCTCTYLNEGDGREKTGGYKSMLSGKSLMAELLEQASQWHEMS